MKYYVLFLALIQLTPCFCQERAGTPPRVAVPLLTEIFRSQKASGSIAYWGRCEAMKSYPDFPTLRHPSDNSRPTLELLRDVFANDPKMEVAQDANGVIRMFERDVPLDLLEIKIHHLSFGSPDQGPIKSYGPNSALLKVEFSPEVQAYKKAHNVGPSAGMFLGPGDAGSKQPVILGDLDDVTVKQALDYILQTFPGFWIYENCKTDEGERTVHFAFFKASQPHS
jgi:hypothetical protein